MILDACEFALTGLHLLANAWDDCPLMSFTVVQRSQCDWLVTALSLHVFIIFQLLCIREPVLDGQMHTSPSLILTRRAESPAVRLAERQIHVCDAKSTGNARYILKYFVQKH